MTSYGQDANYYTPLPPRFWGPRHQPANPIGKSSTAFTH